MFNRIAYPFPGADFLRGRIFRASREFASLLSVCSMVAVAILAFAAQIAEASSETEMVKAEMRIEIDATDLPRKLLYGTEYLRVDSLVDTTQGGDVLLWYPKWLPGTHGPGGPIQNVAGLYITDKDGKAVEWDRTPGEVYQVAVHVPGGVRELVIRTRYITNQPDENSDGVDTFGGELIGFVSPNTVLMYPDGFRDHAIMVSPSIVLPKDWREATAMHVSDTNENEDGFPVVTYEPVTLEAFVDSPIMVGRYTKEYDLIEKDMKKEIAPHRMHVFSEAESVLDVPNDVLGAYRQMVTQIYRLFGGSPFDEFDMLVATTNALGRNGLEHSSSSFNIVGQRFFQSLKGIDGWNQMLLPHEYIHSWCGKYRRPAGMVTHDFHSPKDTDLLWVYEGLTQYLGKVIEVRCGLATEEEFAWELYGNIRSARGRQGRDWRTLADAGAVSHILRAGSRNWSHLRRGQDYYNEGALLWMEADAKIRNLTDGEKALDDFCKVFFARGKNDPSPKGYTRDEIVKTLNGIAEYDWAGFIHERIDEPEDQFGLGLLKEIGYQLQYGNTPAEGPNNAKGDLLDARDSIGASFSSDGTVRTVMLGTPADKVGLGPGMKIVGVGDYVWSRDRFVDTIAESVRTGKIELMLISGDKYIRKVIEYDGGPRFMRLVKSDKKNTRLHDILTARKD